MEPIPLPPLWVRDGNGIRVIDLDTGRDVRIDLALVKDLHRATCPEDFQAAVQAHELRPLSVGGYADEVFVTGRVLWHGCQGRASLERVLRDVNLDPASLPADVFDDS